MDWETLNDDAVIVERPPQGRALALALEKSCERANKRTGPCRTWDVIPFSPPGALSVAAPELPVAARGAGRISAAEAGIQRASSSSTRAATQSAQAPQGGPVGG